MRARHCTTILGSLLWAAIITGCATRGGINDTTGNLGIEKRDSPAKIYVEMGIAYMRDGQDAVALKKLRKALSVDGSNPEAHNVIAILYERLGESEQAAYHYDQAIKFDSKDPYIRNARGSFFCKQNRFKEADDEFQMALANPLYPTPWVALGNAGLCAERAGDKVNAEGYYRRALTANQQYAPVLFQMAGLSFEQGHPMSARAYLERYHDATAATSASLWLGVQVEQKLGDRMKAVEYKRRLLREFPDAPEIQALNQSERER